jgi:hypothetical protein
MSSILDQVNSQLQRFQPSSQTEYLALQFARRLDDLPTLRHYLVLFEHHSEEVLLRVLRECNQTLTGENFMRTLHHLTN